MNAVVRPARSCVVITFAHLILVLPDVAVASGDSHAVSGDSRRDQGARQSRVDESGDPVAELSAGDRPTLTPREAASLRQARNETIERLLSIVVAETRGKPRQEWDRFSSGPLSEAIVLLGVYRAEEAVPLLSGMMTFVPDAGPLSGTTFHYFPVARALVSIGKPAVAPMWRIIYNERSSKVEVDIACWVLIEHYQYVQGDASHSEARTYLIDRIAQRLRASERPVPENVLHALNFILTYEETYEHPYERYPELKPPELEGEPAPAPAESGFFRHGDGDSGGNE